MLVVGPNLSVDRIIRLDTLVPGRVVRTESAHVALGGKGVNVARAARSLGCPAPVACFLPSADAGRLERLATDGTELLGVRVTGSARSATILIEASGRVSVLNEPGCEVGEAEWERLETLVAATAPVRDSVACSGSLPPGSPPDTYSRLVRLSHNLGVVVLVDASGPALSSALGAEPDIVAPNLAEAEQVLLGTRAEDVEPVGPDVAARAAESVRGLVVRGARFAVVTAGSHGAVFGDSERVLWCRAPAVEVTNPIGSGDALVAALLAALGRGDDLPDAVRAGVAAASASCEEELPGALVPSRAADLLAGLPPNELVWTGPGRRRPAGPGRHNPGSRRGEAGPARAVGSGRRPPARREAAASSTLRDVARAAGVSIKTISRVVNDDAEVTSGTAARVREAIADLGYRPNPLARSLRTGYDEAVGLVVERIGDEFFAAVIEAVEESARERGLFLIVASTGTSPEQERAAVDGLLHRSVCGLIVVPSGLDYGLERFAIGPGKAPVVFVDRPPTGMEADTVVIDNRRAASEATSHLLGHGHRRIAFVTPSLEQYTLRNRFEGYREALAEGGVAYDQSIVLVNPTPMTDVSRSLVELLALKDPPTAIFSSNTVASVRVAQALHSSRRTEVAFVAFDDFNTADSLVPAVTVVHQDPTLIARSAAGLLFQRLDGDEAPPKRVVVPTQLVARGSGELPASRRSRAR